MKALLAALAAGLLFGLGLSISEMADPAKVLGFLDLAGAWDPSLGLVMAGALAVAAPGYYFVLHRPKPVLAERFAVPPPGRIDARLLTGAALFGLGWGLVGLCPGPAVASLAWLKAESLWFLAAMAAGMVGVRLVSR